MSPWSVRLRAQHGPQRLTVLLGRSVCNRHAGGDGGIAAQASSCCRCHPGRSSFRRCALDPAHLGRSVLRRFRSGPRRVRAAHPIRQKLLPPSRRSIASYRPRDAPAGAMARPTAPPSKRDVDFDRRASTGVPDPAATDFRDRCFRHDASGWLKGMTMGSVGIVLCHSAQTSSG
jgi:hypothetical protein